MIGFRSFTAALLAGGAGALLLAAAGAPVSGAPFARWGMIELVFEGPALRSAGDPNPFAAPFDPALYGYRRPRTLRGTHRGVAEARDVEGLDNDVTYTPAAGFTATGSFEWRVSDGQAMSQRGSGSCPPAVKSRRMPKQPSPKKRTKPAGKAQAKRCVTVRIDRDVLTEDDVDSYTLDEFLSRLGYDMARPRKKAS